MSDEVYRGNTLPSQCGITLEELAELYKKYGSVKRLAKALLFSDKTTAKWLAIAGVKTLGHRPKKPLTPTRQTEYGKVAMWLKEHPGEKLPYDYKEAAALVGCTTNALKAFVFQRRRRALRYLESLGPLNKFDFTLETTDKRLVNVKFLDEFSYSINPRTLEVIIYSKVRTKDFEFKIAYRKLLQIMRSSRILKVSK